MATGLGRDFERTNSEYLSITDASQSGLDINGHNFLYGNCWAKLETGNLTMGIMGKSLNTGNQRSYLLFHDENGGGAADRFRFFVSSDGSASTPVDSNTYGAPPTGTWLFVQFYHDPDNDEIGISVNNGAFDTAAHSTGIFDGTANFEVGAFNGGGLNFDGIIDSFGIWNVLPDATTRTAMYNSGVPLNYVDLTSGMKTGLVSFYDGQTTGTETDLHGSNDLTDNNTVLTANGNNIVPVLNTLTPLDEATGVVKDSDLVMAFDVALSVDSGNIVIYRAADDSVFQTIDITSGNVTGGGTATITISHNDFESLTAYYVQVASTCLKTSGGNHYAGITDKTTWNFTSEEVAAGGAHQSTMMMMGVG